MMLVECQTCPVRDLHCADCMVTALTHLPVPTRGGSSARPGDGFAADLMAVGPDEAPGFVPLDRAERRAVSALVAVGLVGHEVANEARAVLEPGRLVPAFGDRDQARRAI